ncbi:DUF541 domain-containing protein [Paenibacillus xerothermodurans]|uniref:DUF541 domain-containing protein n=2 Tax=Paenibacillus xerothermodurans TaxID=1977292 RepID=A0A2W1NRM8_PAEXE|nr:DUF541 domain-containing protein [Paenibacillus xerothermodurans]
MAPIETRGPDQIPRFISPTETAGLDKSGQPTADIAIPRHDSIKRRMLEVMGEGTVYATPDQATIQLGAITESVNLATAQSQNTAAINNIVNALRGLGVPAEQMQTVQYSIEPQYTYEDGTQTFRAYRVTHLIQMTSNQVERSGVIVDTAVNAGANYVANIQFTVTQPELFYNQALMSAIMNARQKAAAIANALAVTLNRVPYRVREVERLRPPVPYQATLYAQADVTPIQPGELKITAAVRAEYSYF